MGRKNKKNGTRQGSGKNKNNRHKTENKENGKQGDNEAKDKTEEDVNIENVIEVESDKDAEKCEQPDSKNEEGSEEQEEKNNEIKNGEVEVAENKEGNSGQRDNEEGKESGIENKEEVNIDKEGMKNNSNGEKENERKMNESTDELEEKYEQNENNPHVKQVNVDKPHVEKMDEDKPHVGQVDEENPHVEPVDEDKPHVDQLDEDKPHVEQVDKEKPHVDQVDEDKPHVEQVDKEKQHVETLDEDKPHVDQVDENKQPHVEQVDDTESHVEQVDDDNPHVVTSVHINTVKGSKKPPDNPVLTAGVPGNSPDSSCEHPPEVTSCPSLCDSGLGENLSGTPSPTPDTKTNSCSGENVEWLEDRVKRRNNIGRLKDSEYESAEELLEEAGADVRQSLEDLGGDLPRSVENLPTEIEDVNVEQEIAKESSDKENTDTAEINDCESQKESDYINANEETNRLNNENDDDIDFEKLETAIFNEENASSGFPTNPRFSVSDIRLTELLAKSQELALHQELDLHESSKPKRPEPIQEAVQNSDGTSEIESESISALEVSQSSESNIEITALEDSQKNNSVDQEGSNIPRVSSCEVNDLQDNLNLEENLLIQKESGHPDNAHAGENLLTEQPEQEKLLQNSTNIAINNLESEEQQRETVTNPNKHGIELEPEKVETPSVKAEQLSHTDSECQIKDSSHTIESINEVTVESSETVLPEEKEIFPDQTEFNTSFPNEEIPIVPKASYNLDFLDSLDDPNFDPFSSKTTIRNSPPPSFNKDLPPLKPAVKKKKTNGNQKSPIKTVADSSKGNSEPKSAIESVKTVENSKTEVAETSSAALIEIPSDSKPLAKKPVLKRRAPVLKKKSPTPEAKPKAKSTLTKPAANDPCSEPDRKNSNTEEEIIVPFKGYNLDFLDKLDDPNFNPFESKSTVRNTSFQNIEPSSKDCNKLDSKTDSTLTNVTKEVSEVTNEVSVVTNEVSEVTNDVSEVTNEVSVVTKEVSEVTNKVSEVTNEVSEITNEINEVTQKVGKNLDQPSNLTENIKSEASDYSCDSKKSISVEEDKTNNLNSDEQLEHKVQDKPVPEFAKASTISLKRKPSFGGISISLLESAEFDQLLGVEASRLAEELTDISGEDSLTLSTDSIGICKDLEEEDMSGRTVRRSLNLERGSRSPRESSGDPFRPSPKLNRSPPLGARRPVSVGGAADPYVPGKPLCRSEDDNVVSSSIDSGLAFSSCGPDSLSASNHSEAGPDIATGMTPSDLQAASQLENVELVQIEDMCDEDFLSLHKNREIFKDANDLEKQIRRTFGNRLSGEAKDCLEKYMSAPPREERSAPEGTSSPTPRPNESGKGGARSSTGGEEGEAPPGYLSQAQTDPYLNQRVDSLLKRQEAQFEERMKRLSVSTDKKEAHLHAQMREEQKELEELRSAVAEVTQSREALLKMLEQYKGMLAAVVKDKSSVDKSLEGRVQEMEEEKRQALDDLANVENAFSDVHRKYERTKQVVETMKRNEEALRGKLDEYEGKIKRQESSLLTLQKHAEEKMMQASEEYDKLKQSTDQELTKMGALLKKAEMKIISLQEQLDRKSKDNQELTQLLDDLIAKMGPSK